MILNIIYILLLSLLSAWEEIQQLVESDRWNLRDYRIPYWQTSQIGFKKLWDSHHFSFGLFVLVLAFSYTSIILTWLTVPIFWFVFFYFRNIFMHIVLKKKPIWSFLYTFWK